MQSKYNIFNFVLHNNDNFKMLIRIQIILEDVKHLKINIIIIS